MDMISAIKAGDKRAAARLISMLENHDPEGSKLLQNSASTTAKARVIGITGAPGAGKSTLTDQLVKSILKSGKKIGIIAVDPSSPITGGAFLGDRVRMPDLNSEPNVFIRSMATRGALGGISKAVNGGIRVMELFGAEYIFIETVGIGQSEIDVASQADTVVLVVVPGMGDDIQAEKAGILEVSDIIAVNKADHEDTDRTLRQLKSMLSGQTEPDIIPTIATRGEGIPDLMAAIENHRPIKTKVGRRTDGVEVKNKEDLRSLILARLEAELAAFEKETQAMAHSAADITDEKTDFESEATTITDAYMKWRTQKC